MSAEKIVIDIFLYIFEAWVFWVYANLISTPKRKKSICIGFIALGYLILFIIYQFGNLLYTGISIVVIGTLLFSLLYEISLRRSLFHSVILWVVMFFSEIVAMGFVSIFADASFDLEVESTNVYFLDVTTSKLAYMVISILIAHFFAKKENKEHNTKPYGFLVIMPVSSIIMMTFFRNVVVTSNASTKTYILWIVSTLLVLFSNIVVYIIFETSQKDAIELSDLKAIQQQEENDKRYFEIIEQTNKEMQIFAHDIKNHLIQIRNMEDNEKAKAYIDKIYPDIETFSSIGISQNRMLDLILSKYIKLCESKNISFSVDVKTANLHYIDDTDLSTLLNNVLDNAVEAAENSIKKEISLVLFAKSKSYDVLIVSNSCDTSPLVIGEHLTTTKANKRLHGIGLKSVEKIVNKHKGVYNWNYKEIEKIFETVIAFPKKQ